MRSFATHYFETDSGLELHLREEALLKQRGALSRQEQLAFERAYEALPEEEQASYDAWHRAGACEICDAYGVLTQATGTLADGRRVCDACRAEAGEEA